MQILSATKETKETTLSRKRNLFGLGLTSLIAACGTDKAAGGSGDTDTVPFEAEKAPSAVAASELSGTGEGKSEFTATLGGDSNKFTIAITGGNNPTLTFSDGSAVGTDSAKIYKLTAADTQYDLVVSSFTIDKNEKIGATDDNNPEYQKGGIFIFWNVAGIQDETIGGASTSTTNQRLEIKGAATNDAIGVFTPEFVQIGGTANNYDIVFGGQFVDRASDAADAGAIYILWDVADYAGATKTIDLGKLDEVDPLTGDLGLGATSGSLTIYGKIADDNIGIQVPQLLELGGADNAYDIVIRSYKVNETTLGDDEDEGGIYILWDIAGYHTEESHKTVILDNSRDEDSSAYNNGATYGLLTIYGAKSDDYIGTYAPEFLQIAGKADNYDMVIRSHRVDKSDGSDGTVRNAGAMYVLWDVADYAGKNKTIDLGKLDVTGDLGLGATAGSLAIYGAKVVDFIGVSAPKFLQIAGKGNNYDMVIGEGNVDKPNGSGGTVSGTGAIYILWDVADYANQNVSIDFATPANASSGLLTIYGRGASASLDNDSNNILYRTAADGSKSLTNIDNDAAGTIDIALTDDKYTYIFFGDKVANDANGDDKVDSKTIDLGEVERALGADTAGFFEYDFTANNGLGSATKVDTNTADRVGYRFANNAHKTLADVQGAYAADTSGALSDTDADLGVWDIA